MIWREDSKRGMFIGMMVLVMFLAGCNEPYVVDRIHMVNALGLDKKGGVYSGSALFPVFDPKERMEMTQGSAQTTALMFAQMQMYEDKPLKFGKLRTLLFSQELATEGIDVFIHSICRDPIISPLLIAAVSEQPAEVVLKQLEKKGGGGELHKLVNQNVMAGSLAVTNLHRFMFDYYGEGRDGYLPYIGMDANKNIEVKGTAIFRGDQVALVLGKLDSIAFKMLRPEYKRGFLPVLQEGDGAIAAVVSIVSGRTTMELKMTDGVKEVVFHSKLNGLLKDQADSVHIREEKGYEAMERQIEQQVESELRSLLAKLQAAGVDPLGIGDFVRARDRRWDEKTFYDEVYPTIRLTVRSKVALK